MAYLGNTPTTQSFISGTDYFSGTGAQTAFTLSRTVASVNDIEAVVENVVQRPNDAYTISGTTITFTSAPPSGTNNVYVRYLSTTTQSVTPAQGTVSLPSLNSDLQTQWGTGFKNRIINGDMRIDQRNAGAAVTNSGFPVDRFQIGRDGTAATFTAQQSSTVPTGFNNSVVITTTSAGTAAAGAGYWIQQKIEGFNTADLLYGTANAKTVTLSFWVRSSLTGTFGGSFVNSAFDYSYPFSYTISAANTWEQKTITIAGPTAGTWIGSTNGIGLRVYWDLGSGSDYRGTAGSWAASGLIGVTGGVSVNQTLNATWYITGVQLEVGSTATSFERRPYGTELALCQRYYEKSYNPDVVPGTATDVGRVFSAGSASATTTNYITCPVQFKASKRATPTVTVYDTAGNSGRTTRVSPGIGGTTNSNGQANSPGAEGVLIESTSGNSHSHIAFHYVAAIEL